MVRLQMWTWHNHKPFKLLKVEFFALYKGSFYKDEMFLPHLLRKEEQQHSRSFIESTKDSKSVSQDMWVSPQTFILFFAENNS